MKHKHADLIHAWADGAEIEVYSLGNWRKFNNDDYSWETGCEYRIKPEEKKPVVRWLCAYKSRDGDWKQSFIFMADDEIPTGEAIKLEWSRTEFPS